MTATALQVEKRIYRFDELIADPVRRVLLRDGEAVQITPKAFSILLVLLERHGQIVGKDELIRQVWANSHVSDANLTQNISSLRKALGERAGDGRYVVTVPGQGYCFAAPVEMMREGEQEEPLPPASPPLPPPVGTEPADEAPAVALTVKPRLRIVTGLLVLSLVLALSWWLSWLTRSSLAPATDLGSAAPPRRPSVAVLGFRDLSRSTETQWIGTALAEMLTTELDAGGDVRVISRKDVDRARQFVDIETSGGLAGDSLSRIRSIVGADRVVVGTYLSLRGENDRRIRVDLRVLRASDGDLVASLAETGAESDLFNLVTRAGARLRQTLGYVVPSPERARSARALQPSDPEALRLYSLGLERMRSYDAPHALEALRQAAQADPRSAGIRSALAQALEMLGYDVKAREEAKAAAELSAGLPREERLAMQARLQALEQRWDRASEIYRSLWTFYPDDLEHGLQLAHALMRAGHADDAMKTIVALRRLPSPLGEDPRIDILETRIARRLPDIPAQLRAAEAALAKGRSSGEVLLVAQALIYQGDALLSQGKTEPAVTALREARRLAEVDGHPFILGMALANLGAALQGRGDLAEAEKVHLDALAIAERLGSSLGMAAQFYQLGLLQQQRGELSEAADFLERSLSWQVRNGDRLNEARTLDALGLVLAARGGLDGARERLERALEISRAIRSRRDEATVLSHLGQVLERQGDLSEALRQQEQAFVVLRQLDDPGQAAEALVESASALSRLGDLAGARWRLKLALRAYRRLGNRLGMAEVLDRLSGLEYRMGNLAASRHLSDLELQIARETGSKALFGEALRRSARTDWAMGRLVEAGRDFELALSLRVQEGEDAEAMGIRLDLTRLAISEGRYDEAGRLAREASEWYESREMAGNEAQGRSLLAEALLRQGRLAAAQEAAERAGNRAERSEDREMQVLVAARLARVEAAGGQIGKGIRELRRRIPEAQAAGYVNAVLQARLALGELLLAAGEAEAGQAELLEVRKEAGEHGFALLAGRADEALAFGGHLAGWKG
ncbi:MAG TPA: FlgO family outer membrane protein [Thermoanaerobaculia bacterium]|jgi:DNA-binding winged helix-turn-helix (wHTH) protein/tetratricopeptide (TPR) repeat protein|nr:FlgO family outer membrane protein [Thermoanaerobaculia bacterium]